MCVGGERLLGLRLVLNFQRGARMRINVVALTFKIGIYGATGCAGLCVSVSLCVCCCFFVQIKRTMDVPLMPPLLQPPSVVCLVRLMATVRAGALNTLKWDIVLHHHVTRRRIIPRQQMSRLPARGQKQRSVRKN